MVAVVMPVAGQTNAPKDASFTWFPTDPEIGELVTFELHEMTPPEVADWDFGEAGCPDYPRLVTCTDDPSPIGVPAGVCYRKRHRFSSAGTKMVSVTAVTDEGTYNIGPLDVVVSNSGTCPAASCSYAIDPTSESFGSEGGSSTVSVTAAGGCAWTASTDSGWITINNGAEGSGNGSVSYSVEANSGGARSSTITIAGETFSVSQQSGATPDEIDLVAACLSLAENSVVAGGTLTASYTGVVAGTGTVSESFSIRFYLSDDATVTNLDQVLYELTDIMVTSPGETFSSSSFSFALPTGAEAGSYYLGMIVDWSDMVEESNESNNTITKPLTVLSGILYIPAAAHVAGVGGSSWRTDLEITAIGGDADFTIALLEKNQDNSSPMEMHSSVGAGWTTRFNDVLSLFTFDGSAALRITPTYGLVMATSRTYNDDPGGTFGQFIPANPEHRAIRFGQEAKIIQLSRSATTSSGYRTNIGFVNTTGKWIRVEVKLLLANGTVLGTESYGLKPYEHDQVNDIFGKVTNNAVVAGYAVVWTSTAGGTFFAYASVVDNMSGDAIYIPAQLDAILLAR
jgi:hypothetical protein